MFLAKHKSSKTKTNCYWVSEKRRECEYMGNFLFEC
jgi:hypothetical protein